ncbi:MAG: hypothetical protein DRH20_10905 [Deltaproteobacteria bacterium]|nr:MAG: hypothetical protein DRH20_10905 [Deltaproteobacteria bacterium]
MSKKGRKFKNCSRKPYDCIEGDHIYIQCNAPGKWKVFRKSGQHKGQACDAKKDAKAILLKSYTNISIDR